MHPFYNNTPLPGHPPHGQQQFTSAPQYSYAVPQATALPHGYSQNAFDVMINERCKDVNVRLHNAISHGTFPNAATRQECSYFVDHIRIYRNLLMHTYVHLVCCCRSHGLSHLVERARLWAQWSNVQQLIHHSLIRDQLVSLWEGVSCTQHKSLRAQRFAIRDDDSDLLTLLLHCGRGPELYQLSNKPPVPGHGGYVKESEQVVELLWEFLVESRESDVVRRLRSQIYRMARKSAYLPRALRIGHGSISNERALASGAHGVISVAKMKGQDVIIKRVMCGDSSTQQQCLEMFASEAILWKTLVHKNIVPFLGVVMEGPFNMGLVSQFFKNGNVKNYIKRCNPRDWLALARRWGKDLAEGLQYIHSHEPPIIHGDLKGDNVLVDDQGHARLGDFGQSHASDSGKFLDSTRVGLATNSPIHWMAPELVAGADDAKNSDKSDIYSFGCVLYEMVSGKIPFEGHSWGAVVQYITQRKRPNRPDSISKNDPFWRIVELCWENDPARRPSAEVLASSFAV